MRRGAQRAQKGAVCRGAPRPREGLTRSAREDAPHQASQDPTLHLLEGCVAVEVELWPGEDVDADDAEARPPQRGAQPFRAREELNEDPPPAAHSLPKCFAKMLTQPAAAVAA